MDYQELMGHGACYNENDLKRRGDYVNYLHAA
jgi:hypothetical protein